MVVVFDGNKCPEGKCSVARSELHGNTMIH